MGALKIGRLVCLQKKWRHFNNIKKSKKAQISNNCRHVPVCVHLMGSARIWIYLIFKHFLTELALNSWQLADMPRLLKMNDQEINGWEEEFAVIKFTIHILHRIC